VHPQVTWILTHRYFQKKIHTWICRDPFPRFTWTHRYSTCRLQVKRYWRYLQVFSSKTLWMSWISRYITVNNCFSAWTYCYTYLTHFIQLKYLLLSLNYVLYEYSSIQAGTCQLENLNPDPQGPVATGNLDLQVRISTGIPTGKPKGNPYGPAPVSSLSNKWWCDDLKLWWLENWSTVQITCIASMTVTARDKDLLHWLGNQVQSSTIECTNISEARLKLLISGTDNNCL